MGNRLCKENSHPGSANKLGCLQFCPSLAGKKDHHWNKHIYETRPPVPVRQQPQLPTASAESESGWKTITLNRPLEYRSNNMDLAPIPPPRKKRTSMLSLKNVGAVKNGFKDVFGSDTPRRYSVDSIHNSKRYRERNVDNEIHARNSVSCHDVCDMSTAGEKTTVKLPSVGNKKSDKVLGENLSDLSDDSQGNSKLVIAAAAVKDPIEKFVEENVVEKKLKLDQQEKAPARETEQLLCNYINRHSDEVCYKDREPVVEEIIIPRKKKTGHICDDDDFHKKFHSKESHAKDQDAPKPEQELESLIVPKKPQRDMAIYRRSLENLSQNEPEAVVPVRRKKSIKSPALPDSSPTTTTQPPAPISPVNEKASTADANKIVPAPEDHLVESLPISSDDKISQGKHLKRYQSSGSFFNQDSVSKMSQRVMEFQMNDQYVMEDISMDENDGSQYTPRSKLDPITKKISVVEEPIHPVEIPVKKLEHSVSTTSDSVSTDGSNTSQRTVVQYVPAAAGKNITDLPAEDNLFNQSSLLLAEKNVENILTSDLNMEVLSHVLNDMYDKTVLDEFQTYLETEGTDLDDELKLVGDHSDGLIRDLKLRKADKISVSPTPVIEAIDLADVPPKLKGYLDRSSRKPSEEDQVSLGSISDDGYTNLVAGGSREDITNKTLLAVATEGRPRRESICDVDNWFNKHIDPAPSSSLLNVNNARMMRRGSDFLVGYDTGSTFPFGRSRQDSESSEFFENRMVSKSVENINKGSTGSLNHKEPNSNHSSNTSLNKDHSGLLKFICKEAETEAANKNKHLEDMKNYRNKKLNAVVPRIEIVISSGEGDEDTNK